MFGSIPVNVLHVHVSAVDIDASRSIGYCKEALIAWFLHSPSLYWTVPLFSNISEYLWNEMKWNGMATDNANKGYSAMPTSNIIVYYHYFLL